VKQLSGAFRKSLVAFVATSILVGVTVLVCEMGFRTLLFSQVAFMDRFREPSLYADPLTDNDWWKLYHAFNKPTNDTAKHSHPLLGWGSDEKFSKETYLHAEAGQVGSRQPVLLYGDSFTHCLTASEDCFHGILNSDPEFSKGHYLLNYGVLGYGVDQIYLLLQNSLPNYHKPVVAVGIYTGDLNRSILSFFMDENRTLMWMPVTLSCVGSPLIRIQERLGQITRLRSGRISIGCGYTRTDASGVSDTI
jgi:hypothetical protein